MKTIFHIIASLLFCTTISFAQNNHGFVIPQEKFVDTLDIDMIDQKPMVKVKIGEKTYRFLFDTGSTITYLSTADMPGVTLTGDSSIVNGTNGSKTECMATISDMQIGSLKFKNISAVIHKVHATTIEDGILGYDLLQAGIVAKFMLKDKKIILTNNPSIFESEKGKRISLDKNIPLFIAEPFKGFKVPTLLDTGSPYGFLLSLDQWRYYIRSNKIPKNVKKQIIWYNKQTMHQDLHNDINDEFFFKFENIKVKDLNFHQIAGHTTIVPFSTFGTQLLSEFDFILNTSRKEVVFLSDQKEFYPNTQGVQFKVITFLNDPKVNVLCLNPYSELFKLGVRTLDIIDEVDGIVIDNEATFVKVCSGKSSYHAKFKKDDGTVIEADVVGY